MSDIRERGRPTTADTQDQRQTYGTRRERFRGAGDHTCWGDLNRFGYQTDAVDTKKDEKKLDNGRIAWYTISVLIQE